MTRDRNTRTAWAIPLMGFLLLAALPANAELPGREAPAGRAAIHAGSMSFTPEVAFESMEFTVGGKGFSLKQRFSSGQTATFLPVDEEGNVLPDGIYNWEAVLSPRRSGLDAKALSNGKISADGRMVEAAALPRGKKQSGVFTIKNGMMVDPAVVEAPSAAGAPSRAVSVPDKPSAAARAAEHTDRDQG